MADYNFVLPFPPSVNSTWRAFKGRTILSKRGREYRNAAIDALIEQGLAGEHVVGRLSVTVRLYPPTTAKRDIDNFTKSLFDALTHGGFWLDDEQVDRLIIERCDKVKGGAVTVSATVIEVM